jgi:Fe-S oxidoreductase
MSKKRVHGLERVKDQLTRCIACTECYGRGPHVPYADGVDVVPNWVCPILDQFKFVTNTARSQQAIARGLAYGHLTPDESIAKIFYACTTCGICGTFCPRPLVDTVRAMREQLRTDYPELYPKGLLENEKKIKEKHNFFGARSNARDRWSSGLNMSKKTDTLYFAGCYASYRQPKTAQSVVKVLRAAGQEVTILGGEEWCCGSPVGWAGNWALEEEMAHHNVNAIKALGVKRVVFSCAECYRAFKSDYPQIIGNLPFEIAHVVEVYAELIRLGKLPLTRTVKESVTYHDPCYIIRQHLGRHQDIYEQPRSVIQAVPGIMFQEMALNRRFASCCGSGGGVTSTAYPKEAAWFAQARIRQAAEVSKVVVTACPRCEEQFGQATRETGVAVDVCDISQFLADAIGL